METKTLRLLRIAALILGWFLFAGIWVGILGWLGIYQQGQSNPLRFSGNIAQFKIVGALSSFFSALGNAFFAFLIAAVLRMIDKQAPVAMDYARRLMIVCCLSYLADSGIRLSSLVTSVLETLNIARATGGSFFEWWWLLPYASAATAFIPLLYAASIYILYTRFAGMVTFESEVA